jgi:hypothetical protein
MYSVFHGANGRAHAGDKGKCPACDGALAVRESSPISGRNLRRTWIHRGLIFRSAGVRSAASGCRGVIRANLLCDRGASGGGVRKP